MNASRDDTPDGKPEEKPGRDSDRGKEPTHAPGEDALPGRRGPRPYPVDDPDFGDPRKTPGAQPDVTPVRPGRPKTM